MVSMDMISLFKTITGISWTAPPGYWTREDGGTILLEISTFFLFGSTAGGGDRI